MIQGKGRTSNSTPDSVDGGMNSGVYWTLKALGQYFTWYSFFCCLKLIPAFILSLNFALLFCSDSEPVYLQTAVEQPETVPTVKESQLGKQLSVIYQAAYQVNVQQFCFLYAPSTVCLFLKIKFLIVVALGTSIGFLMLTTMQAIHDIPSVSTFSVMHLRSQADSDSSLYLEV